MSVTDFISALAANFPSDEMNCLNEANASPQVASIDATVANLSMNWHPTGYYDPADVQMLLDLFAQKAADAGDALASAPMSTSDAATSKKLAFDDAIRVYQNQSLNYAQAVSQARASGVAINAPGFKEWVLKSMGAISNVWATAAVLHCHQSWIADLLGKAANAMAAIGAAAWRVLGVAYDLAKGAVNALEAGLGFVAWLAKYSKWILIVGVGGLALYAGLQLYRKHFEHGLPTLPEAWQLPD
jgi:hypothetical protein